MRAAGCGGMCEFRVGFCWYCACGNRLEGDGRKVRGGGVRKSAGNPSSEKRDSKSPPGSPRPRAAAVEAPDRQVSCHS